MEVPDSDKELFKTVVYHLQVEKNIRKTKIFKLLTALIKEAEEYHKERSRETPAHPQQAPAQTAASVKYKAPDLIANSLRFPCTPFKFLEWKDNI